MIISQHAIRAFLGRKLDSHVWMKRIKKDKLLAEIRQLKVRPIFHTESWEHQLACFWLGIHYPKFMFALTMGAGKTKINADIFTQLQREKRVRRGLVITPRIINIDTWNSDLYEHSDLEPWLVDCINIEEKRERLHYPKGDLTITDLSSLQWGLCEKRLIKGQKKRKELAVNRRWLDHVAATYDYVCLDESHKVCKPDSLWWDMIDRLTAKVPYVYGNTGTLFDRDIQEAWAQMHLVDGGETFGTNQGIFRASLMREESKPWKGSIWVPQPGIERTFNKMLQHRSINYEEHELFDLPPIRNIPMWLSMGTEQQDHYLRAVDGIIDAGGDVTKLESQWYKLRQITSGYLNWEDANGEHTIFFKDNPKLDAVERILDELGGRRKLIICHDYRLTGKMICDRLAKLGVDHVWYYGGTKDKIATKDRFIEDKRCLVMVANSEAIGTGTDGLQKVCQYMAFYESPTPPKTRNQTERRLKRPGLIGRTYNYDLIVKRSVDAGILQSIKEGHDFYARFMGGRVARRDLLD